jgi:hypothetical protein
MNFLASISKASLECGGRAQTCDESALLFKQKMSLKARHIFEMSTYGTSKNSKATQHRLKRKRLSLIHQTSLTMHAGNETCLEAQLKKKLKKK